jgi:hypothetical protein
MINNNLMHDQKTFNMDGLFIERINNRLEQLDIATVENNQIARYRLLNVLYIDTQFKFSNDENNNIEEKLKNIKDLFNSNIDSNNKITKMQHSLLIISSVETKLDDLHILITRLLFAYDLIYLKKIKQLTPEEEFLSDY